MADYPYINHQSELNQLLSELSVKVHEDVSQYAFRFADIYDDDDNYIRFRHSYGSITGHIFKECDANPNYFSNLDQNFNSIIDTVVSYAKHPNNSLDEAKRFVLLQLQIEKLRDHISLEYTRKTDIYEGYKQKANQAELHYSEATELLDTAKQQAVNASRQYEQAIEQAKNATQIKNEVVSILSIFSAVILAFMGGVSLLGSAFQSISGASVYKVFAAILLCAMAMFNTISVLMYFVSKIVGTSITVKCKTENCSCSKPCSLWKKLKNKLPLLFWLNIFFLTLLLLCIVAWILDFHAFATWFRSILPWIK